MKKRFLTTLVCLPLLAAAPVPVPSEIVAAAPAADWTDIAATDLLVMDLEPDGSGRARQIIIQLAPPPFAEGWVHNIRDLARQHWWDGLAIVRVQDNYVAQWGDPHGEDAAKARPVPGNLRKMTAADYVSRAPLPPHAAFDALFVPANRASSWSSFYKGWPIAGQKGRQGTSQWLVHCYGMVGVGRSLAPDTGSGAELYAVIGHAPRHLDRNIALVGRVIDGMANLSSLPRGNGPLGFYETSGEQTGIRAVRLASELATADRPKFQFLSTESRSFLAYAKARANRRDAFFSVPAGGADLCKIPVPVRRAP
jgi:peptidylprolyl isomerase